MDITKINNIINLFNKYYILVGTVTYNKDVPFNNILIYIKLHTEFISLCKSNEMDQLLIVIDKFKNIINRAHTLNGIKFVDAVVITGMETQLLLLIKHNNI